MTTDTLVVGHNEALEAVSLSLLEDDHYHLKQHFIVTRYGLYAGLGSTRSLLRMMARRQIHQPQQTEPNRIYQFCSEPLPPKASETEIP